MNRILLLSLMSALAISAQTLVVTNEVHDGTVNYGGVETGVANAYAFSNPSGYTLSSYKAGVQWCFIAAHTNTAASTLNIDAIGAITIKKFASGVETDVVAGDIAANQPECVLYNSTTSHWDLSSLSAATGGGSAQPGANVVVTSHIPAIAAAYSTYQHAVAPGSSNAGCTDASSLINPYLANGNTLLINDMGLCLSSSLAMYSGDYIWSPMGDANGFIGMAATNVTLVVNAHPTAPTATDGTVYFLSSAVDTNITLDGGIYNQDSKQVCTGTGANLYKTDSSGNWIRDIRFIGVTNLTLKNLHTFDSCTFNITITNALNVIVDNVFVEMPTTTYFGGSSNPWNASFPWNSGYPATGKNTDGIDIVGPASHVHLSRIHANVGDDSIAICGDTWWSRSAIGPNYNALYGGPYAVKDLWGPIFDVTMDDIYIDTSANGIRLMSSVTALDQINIRNVHGTVQNNWIEVSNSGMTNGTGKFGRIVIDDVTAGFGIAGVNTFGGIIGVSGTYAAVLNGTIDDFTLTNYHIVNPPVAWPAFGQWGTLGNLHASDWVINNLTGTTVTPQISLNGTVTTNSFAGVSWTPPTADTTSTLFGGTTAPVEINLTNYWGPQNNRILAAGFNTIVAGTSTGVMSDPTWMQNTPSVHAMGLQARLSVFANVAGTQYTGYWPASSTVQATFGFQSTHALNIAGDFPNAGIFVANGSEMIRMAVSVNNTTAAPNAPFIVIDSWTWTNLTTAPSYSGTAVNKSFLLGYRAGPVTLRIVNSGGTSTFQFSLDNGSTWTTIDTESLASPANAGLTLAGGVMNVISASAN